MVRVIAELGSCHMGKLEYITEAIDRCKDNGINALKLQLFPDGEPYVYRNVGHAAYPTLAVREYTGNVHLPQTLFLKAFEYGNKVGLSVSASVFDLASAHFLAQLKPDFIKFAFSKKDQVENYVEFVDEGVTELIVSCDVMTRHLVPKRATKLYCIPEYPVRYEVAFDGLFGFDFAYSSGVTEEQIIYGPAWQTQHPKVVSIPGRFDGFSDHTLGMRQTFRAVEAGAKIIEKHVTLPNHNDINCPDNFFAVSIEELGQLKK